MLTRTRTRTRTPKLILLTAFVLSCGDPSEKTANSNAHTDASAPDTASSCTTPSKGTASRVWVGINDFDEALMGAPAITVKGHTAPFRWTVPTRGEWTLEVHVEHGGGFVPGCETPVIRCADGRKPSRDDFEPSSGTWQKTKKGHTWRAKVLDWHPEQWGEPASGPATGDASAPSKPCKDLRIEAGGKAATHGFDWAELTIPLDPFDKVDKWMFDFSRDRSALDVTKDKDDNYIVRTPKPWKPNGTPDFDEALKALGLLGPDAGWNAKYHAHIRKRVIEQVRAIYHLNPTDGAIGKDSVRIRFEARGENGAPDSVEAAKKAGWSAIAIGGDDVLWKKGGKTFFGRATVDFNNTVPNINTTNNRGVFVSSLARFALENGSLANLMSDFAPIAGGKPLGTMPGDLKMLDKGFDPEAIKEADAKSRAELFVLLDRLFSLAIAAITAHEMGHSLGMVKPGPPPRGLFGGATHASFITAAVDDHHIDTPGLNIMQTGASLKPQELFAGQPYFAAFNLAYLRRRIVVVK